MFGARFWGRRFFPLQYWGVGGPSVAIFCNAFAAPYSAEVDVAPYAASTDASPYDATVQASPYVTLTTAEPLGQS